MEFRSALWARHSMKAEFLGMLSICGLKIRFRTTRSEGSSPSRPTR